MVDRNYRKGVSGTMPQDSRRGMNGGCHMHSPRPRQDFGGCGCCENGGCDSDCKVLMRKLQTVEFSMYDVMLYLDIYPECLEALAYYGKLRDERDALRASLAGKCHRPVTACESDLEQGWSWIESPWPWDTAAN